MNNITVLKIKLLRFDESYQRPLPTPTRLRALGLYDPLLAGAITVNRRASGEYYVIDGRTRCALASAAGATDIRCLMHYDLTQAQEADMFAHLAVRRNIMRPQLMRARATAGDPVARAIIACLQSIGLDLALGKSSSSTRIACAQVLEDVAKRGVAHLKSLLLLLREAWGMSLMAIHGDALSAVDALLYTFPELSRDRLVRALSGTTIDAFRATAKVFATGPRARAKSIAVAMVSAYNHRCPQPARLDAAKLV